MYTYTQANRLITVTASGLTWSATYNGDGARLTQVTNGTPTTYTLDLAAPLVTVLAQQDAGEASETQYLYGLDDSPLASYDGTAWTYLSGRDGLNSVRQETDASGNVLTARGFDPYGVPLSGNGGALFGYTGEVRDSYTQLVFLRARYMQPGLGMFISRDPWMGYDQQPGTYNGFNYAIDNPINLSDPAGLMPPYPPGQMGQFGPAFFAVCFSLHTMSQSMPGDLGYLNMTARQAVDICRMAYNKSFWDKDFFHFELGLDLPKTTHELFGWYVHDWRGRYNSDRLFFDANEPLTQELFNSDTIADVRLRYCSGGNLSLTLYDFNTFEQFLAFLDAPLPLFRGEVDFPISMFMGSFYYQVKTLPDGRVGFRIDNDTDLSSGTHIAHRYRREGYYDNVETLIERNPDLANKPLSELVKDKKNYLLISILKNRSRAETNGSGGGNLYQTFTWTEKRDCSLPWCFMGVFFDSIEVWDDYKSMTIDPTDFPPQ